MEIPLIELANYPRFHEAAGAALEVASSLLGPCAIVFVCHDADGVVVVNTSGSAENNFSAGDVMDPSSDVTAWVQSLHPHGAIVQSGDMQSPVGPYRELIGAPVTLSDGRSFGSVCGLTMESGVFASEHLSLLRSLARLLGYAIDAELLASHDRLTGLYTRRVFDDHLALEIARARRNGVCLAVLTVSFTVPLEMGILSDARWLPRVAERLRTSVREGDTISRLGARDFGLIVPDLRDGEAARRVARALVDSLQDPFEAQGKAVSIVPAVGVALLPYDGFDAASLLERAVEAMNQARLDGNDGYGLYSEGRGLRLIRR